MVIDKKFLDSNAPDLNDGALNLYFDGAVPHWRHALSDKIPRRKLVGQLVEKFDARRVTPAAPLFQLLLGAGGEGKSTAVLQVAADLARIDGWTVLWRPEPEIGFNPDAFLEDADNQSQWLLVLDDAETAVQWMFALAQALSVRSLSNVHLLGCARDTDWYDANRRPRAWDKFIDWKTKQLRGFEDDDSRRIVEAWRNGAGGSEVDGMGIAEAAGALEKAAKKDTARHEGSFFGGVLATRFSPDGLVAHITDLLNRLGGRNVGSGTLMDALSYASLVHTIGIRGIDYRVVGDLLGIPHGNVRSSVEKPLGDEAGAVRAGTALLARHRRIAEVVVRLLDSEFGLDLGEQYGRLVKQVIDTGQTGLRLANYSPTVHCGPKLVGRLPSDVPLGQRASAAVAAASAACEAAPDRLSYVVDLAGAWRAAGELPEATEIFERTTPDEYDDYDDNVRGFYYEWSVTEGQAERKANNVWLAAYSISDAFRPPVTWENAKTCLAGLGVAFLNLAGHDGTSAVAKGMRACAVLGLKTGPDETTEGYFDRYRRAADRIRVLHPADDAEALAWLSEGVEAIRSKVSADVLDRTGHRPSFGGLAGLLGVRITAE